ncbi:MAG: bifunctional nuclease family protein, partial [Phycisphaeraceae bacterium]|nr:bifunctional nuclease family protein [Phycisphaeraceae bacterium]
CMSVPMELARILIRETNDSHIVELREVDGERIFPIVIGLYEAAAIERRVMGEQPIRPQTHELLASVIDALGAQLDRIEITDLQDNTFYAELVLVDADGGEIRVDSRPSDAIALAVKDDVPFRVAEHVLDEVTRGG